MRRLLPLVVVALLVGGSAQQGAGLLGLDVATLDDGRDVDVHRRGQPRVPWPQPVFLVGEHGARLADEPPSSGAWRPFALRALAGWTGALLILAGLLPWLARRSPDALQQLGFVIFGQRDPAARPVTRVPGVGGHGSGGGQVPPLVPDNPAWDPDRRIR